MNGNSYSTPDSLQAGAQFLMLLRPLSTRNPIFAHVIYLHETACPAVVVVLDVNNHTIRCNRRDLFVISPPGKTCDPSQE